MVATTGTDQVWESDGSLSRQVRLVGGTSGDESVASLSGQVVAAASSTTPLVAAGVFESPRFAIHNYATIEVSVRADQNSAASGLTIEQFSSDDELESPDPLHSRSTTVAAATANQGVTMTVKAAWAVVRLVNGGSDQTALDLTTLLKPVATTDFPSLGPKLGAESISTVPATDAVFEITQLDYTEDSVTARQPQLTVVGAAVTTDGTTLVAAPAAGSHLVVSALFAFRKETGSTAFDVGFRPGTGGTDVFRPTLVAEGQMWQSNFGFEWHLASATALVADLPGGTLAGGGLFVTVAYETRPDA
jgi:hypothetical protein